MGTGKNSDKIKDYQRQIAQGFFYIGVTIVVFTAVCIAWFVSNTKVSASGMTISAADDTKILLASTGERQVSEKGTPSGKDGYKTKEDENQWKNILTEGMENSYQKYIDCSSKQNVALENSQSLKLHTGTSGLAWYLNGQQKLSPGEGGELELYFIPKQAGLQQVTFTLTMEGYTDDTSEGANGTVKAIKDDTAKNYLNTHILLFQNKDGTKGYSNLLGLEKSNNSNTYNPENRTFSVKASDFSSGSSDTHDTQSNNPAAFTVDTPYKITIYWKWPKMLHNYVYNDKYSEELFLTGGGDDQKALLNYINANLNYIFDLSQDSAKATVQQDADSSGSAESVTIGSSMSTQDFAQYSDAYDKADEYIGKKVEYVFVKVAAEAS